MRVLRRFEVIVFVTASARDVSAVSGDGFSGRVRAYVGGEQWRGDVRAIPLRPHAQIVLEVGGYVPPHRFFLFGGR